MDGAPRDADVESGEEEEDDADPREEEADSDSDPVEEEVRLVDQCGLDVLGGDLGLYGVGVLGCLTNERRQSQGESQER